MKRKIKYGSNEYNNIHQKVNRKFGKANDCENPSCEKKSNRFDWAIKPEREYSLERKDYQMLCRKCHIAQDSKNISRVLSKKDIINIHRKLKNGATFSEIRKMYSISNDTIRRLYKGKFNSLDWSFLIKRRHKINAITFERMEKMLLKGCFTSEISQKLNINIRYIPDLFKSLAGMNINEFLRTNNITRSYNKEKNRQLKHLASSKIKGGK